MIFPPSGMAQQKAFLGSLCVEGEVLTWLKSVGFPSFHLSWVYSFCEWIIFPTTPCACLSLSFLLLKCCTGLEETSCSVQCLGALYECLVQFVKMTFFPSAAVISAWQLSNQDMICYWGLKTSSVSEYVEWEMLLQSSEIGITCRECVWMAGGLQCVCDMGINEVSRQLGAAFSLASYWMQQLRQLSDGRRRAVVIVVFVLCALMENVFYKAWGSRLVGSRELLHKVILLLSNLMWCTVKLSSQVALSHLHFLLVWFVWEVSLCSVTHVREGMLNEVLHSGPCVVH